MKRKMNFKLLVLLFIVSLIIKSFASNNQPDSTKKVTIVELDSSVQQTGCLQYNDYNDTITLELIPQQQVISEKSNLHNKILFWVTIITSVASLIMLLIAIIQLHRQRSDSIANSTSTNALLNNLNTLIQNQENNTIKAREDRLKVLSGLNEGVCKINTQIFNNVLTDIAIKKQEIHANCNNICFYFKRNPYVLKEDFAIKDPRVLDIVVQIENSIATLKEMFVCYGYYNDDCRNAFGNLITVIERLKNEPGIAPTKQLRDGYLNDILSAENDLMLTADTIINEMRTLIDEN